MKRRICINEIADYSKGQQINGDDLLADGKYDYLNGGINPSGKWSDYNVEGGTVTISEGGNSSGYVNYMNSPFWCGAHCYYLYNVKGNTRYLYYALKSQQDKLMGIRSGACMPNIKKSDLGKFEVWFDTDINEQVKVIEVLEKVENIIQARKRQLEAFDQLIKARFVEMFGDPELNPMGWEQVTLNDVCSSIVRGPFGSALKKEFFVEPDETTYKVYEQKHAIQKSASIGTYYITEEKYQELKRFECLPGDILMSCSGTMGELYQLPDGCEKGVINQALCKFTLNERILPICFLVYMKQTIGNLETKGSGIQNIAAVSYVKQMPINLPPMDVQNEFEQFVHQVDKSKVVDIKAA
ncbi:restriction endonuclease subunit S [Roseburia sp. AM16-25]|uniref:restriction endonuclease subunit S n=1 Tax=Roseburia sp. AM16-25 TaxID=2292065 RepID=UPI000E522A4F|nr:restriction endonuclease subunit S [Roseburia sp. AM16-25]RHO29343.1 restriction endonuclease subunit S [Roseburia sp. AM16-25]